jgi:ComF family protein
VAGRAGVNGAAAPFAKPTAWRRGAAALAQLFFPRVCVACDEGLDDRDDGLVCGRCWARLPRLPAPQCARCGHPKARRGDCAVCALLPPFVRAARSVCWVPDPVSSPILGALKYEGWPAVAAAMGERMARLPWPEDVVEERVALLPVPLARVRERERGFNQAERLAAAVGRHWAIPVWTDVLERTRATPSQTRLTPGERLANVHRAFSLTNGDDAVPRIRGRHLVLVDDVLTTGATLNACADVLFDAGARTLSYLTFGRAKASTDASSR